MYVRTVEPFQLDNINLRASWLYRIVPNSEVDLHTQFYVVGTAVFIREVAYIQSVLYREVPL